jgi:hypothetical protein
LMLGGRSRRRTKGRRSIIVIDSIFSNMETKQKWLQTLT